MMMIKKIEQTVKKYHLLEKGDAVVIGLSGGADSCALLLGLGLLSEIYSLKLIVAHFNHGLRGAASDGDEVFCRSLAQKSDLLFETESMRSLSVPKGLSPEDYYRQERYRFLDQVALAHGANKIALGHHLHDQAETVLINILRGCGLDGLKGFLPMRDGKYIRPLIEVSRQEIIAFLKQTDVEYRKDSSNESQAHLRNRVRMALIPFLKDNYNPRIEQNLVRMAEIIRRDDEFIDGCVREIILSPHVQKMENACIVSVEYFKTLPSSLCFRLIRALLESLAPDGKGFSFAHIQALVDLTVRSSSGKRMTLPYGLSVRKEYDRIILEAGKFVGDPDYEYPLKIPGTLDLQERKMILSTRRAKVQEIDFHGVNRICFDADKIAEPLVIRNRRRGDWFEPLGTKGSQKIKKLFIDRKLPRQERERIALLVDQESVIWIENMHLSDRVKVSPETKNVMILEMCPI